MMPHAEILSSIHANLESWPLLLPELWLVATIVVVLIIGWTFPQYQHYWLIPLALGGTALAWYSKYWLGSRALIAMPNAFLFNRLLILDQLAVFGCLLLLSITLCLLFLIPASPHLASERSYRLTHVVLLLGASLGSCLLTMACHWLTIYLGVTLVSLSSTLLISNYTTPKNLAASLKYLLYSMVTSNMMLWGMSYYYGFTSTLSLTCTGLATSLQQLPSHLLLVVLLLCMSSVFYMLTVVPYHFWIPDIYQASSTEIVAYLATIPKMAAFFSLLRVFDLLVPQLDTMGQAYISNSIGLLALLTIIVGNTAALAQAHGPKLLAYSHIAQGGLLMAGLATYPSSQIGLLYYTVAYSIMGLATWVGLSALQYLAGSARWKDFAGLGKKFPLLGSNITLIMLALSGVPPTANFVGKLLILTALWEYAQCMANQPLFIVLFVASLFSTIFSMYYALKLPYVLFDVPSQSSTNLTHSHTRTHWILGILAMLLLIGFLAADHTLSLLTQWLPKS